MSEHLRLPLRLTPAGRLATVVEDTVEEIAQNVTVLLRTRPGERLATPTLGLPDPVFTGLDPAVALEVVREWEPRADLQLLDQVLAADGTQTTSLLLRRRTDLEEA